MISKASDESNKKHLDYQIEYFKRSQPQSEPITLDSVTYKPESTMIEESQQLAYAAGLAKSGFSVTIRERPSVVAQVKEIYGDLFRYEEAV